MRILAVGNLYPPHHLGGYELVWRSSMRHLRSEGHASRVLTSDFRLSTDEPDDPDTFRELRWYWRDHVWPRIGWRARIALERDNAGVLDRHLDELRPDVVSWWAMGGMSLALVERVRRLGIPAVAFVHDDWLLYAPRVDRWTKSFSGRPRLGALAERVTGLPARIDLEAAARYVLVSETVRSRARSKGYVLANSAIAHSGIDPAYLDPRPERPWEWRMLYVGRVDERKGVSDAVAALEDLPGAASLTIVGGGDQRVSADLTRLAERLGVRPRVLALGMRSRGELPDIYAASDVVLFPVRWQEPWGLVPLEAMALGRLVIATGQGGSGEYLRDQENCLLVPPGEPRAIAAAVRRLADDPQLRARIRAGGLQTARGLTETAFNRAVLTATFQLASPR
jgi:glycosyltransferase involved in cell wall biosynthesis